MAKNTHQNLVFLERQFNTIKQLIPSSNEYVSQALTPEKLVKQYFNIQSYNWDLLQSESKKQLHGVNLLKSEETFLSERILLLMNFLIQLKRVSVEANNTQKSLKITLYELMLRLRDQVMKESPFEIVPSFIQLETIQKKPKNPSKNKIKNLFVKRSEKSIPQAEWLESLEIPEFMSKVLKEQYHCLSHLSNLHQDHDKRLLAELDKYEKHQANSMKRGKEYEAKAYEIISRMVRTEKELNEYIRMKSNPFLIEFVPKVKERIQSYINEK